MVYNIYYIYHIFLIYLTVDGHLDCFPILAVVNNAAIIIDVLNHYIVHG